MKKVVPTVSLLKNNYLTCLLIFQNVKQKYSIFYFYTNIIKKLMLF